MNKRITLRRLWMILCIGMTMITFPIFSQDFIQFGDPGSASLMQNYPFDLEYMYARSASIYNLSTQFRGTITKLAWYVGQDQPSSAASLKIRVLINETGVDEFPENLIKWDSLASGADLVVSLRDRKFTNPGWDTLLFTSDRAFIHSPDANILILCEQWGAQSGGVIPKFTYTDATNRHAFKSDNNQLNVYQLSRNNQRPDIRIYYITDPESFNCSDSTSGSLKWEWPNTRPDNILIIRNTANSFTDPPQGSGDEPPEIGNDFCGGKVAYKGTDSAFTDDSLERNNIYYYKIMKYYKEVNELYYYSPGTIDFATTTCFDGSNVIHFNNVRDTITICSGASPGEISGEDYLGSGVNYQWESRLDGQSFDTISGATGSTYQPGPLVNTTYYRRTASAINDCHNISNVVVAFVDPASVGGTISGVVSLCQNSEAGYELKDFTGRIQRWEIKKDAGSWNTIYNSADSSKITYHFTDYGTSFLRVMVRSGVCDSAYSDPLVIEVKQSPLMNPVFNSPVCLYDRFTMILNPVPTDATIAWQRDCPEITGIPEVGNGATISGILSSSSVITEEKIITFNITVTANQCQSIFNQSVIVKPAPESVDILGDKEVCWGYETRYTLANINTDVDYVWDLTDQTAGTIISPVTGDSVLVSWHETTEIKSTQLIVTGSFQNSDCKTSDSIQIDVNPYKAPVDTLIRKQTQDTSVLFLMCSKFINDTAINYTYDWGYEENGTAVTNPYFKDMYFCVFQPYHPDYHYFLDLAYRQETGDRIPCTSRIYYDPSRELKLFNHTSIYPNPNTGNFSLNLFSTYLGEVTIELHSLPGSLIANQKIIKIMYQQVLTIEFPGIDPGIYLVSVRYATGDRSILKMSVY